jgi:hypothetical protein
MPRRRVSPTCRDVSPIPVRPGALRQRNYFGRRPNQPRALLPEAGMFDLWPRTMATSPVMAPPRTPAIAMRFAMVHRSFSRRMLSQEARTRVRRATIGDCPAPWLSCAGEVSGRTWPSCDPRAGVSALECRPPRNLRFGDLRDPSASVTKRPWRGTTSARDGLARRQRPRRPGRPGRRVH